MPRAMELPDGRGTFPAQTPYDSTRGDDDWNSPLWEQPETVAAPWHRGPDEPPAQPPVVPGEPRRRRSRALLASAAVVLLLVALAGTALVDGAFSRGSTTTGAERPRQSLPAIPAPAPNQPSLTPPGESNQGGSQSPTENQAAAAVSAGLVDVVSTIGYDGAEGAGTGVVLTRGAREDGDGLICRRPDRKFRIPVSFRTRTNRSTVCA